MSIESRLKALAERWAAARPAERANAQLYIGELCDALGIEPPRPAGSGYEFELPIRIVNRDGSESQGFIDLYKRGCFLLEAKADDAVGSSDVLLRRAFGQARMYTASLPDEAPWYLLVLDVPRTLLVWDRFAGSYGGFNAARRIDLRTLHERPADIALLRDVWEDPTARDPRTRATAVTQEIAARLAQLAAALEARGFAQERVARFLMRCVFTMFAEDVHLLPDEPFRRIIDEVALANPSEFAPAAEDLWRAMDEGRRFGFRKLLKFNGHFFREAEALPLTRDDLALLLEAARADWSEVEPTIFGTLLVRALDPEERHRLGAEYTPREFIERLVRPTIEEPIRERWTAVQAEVLQRRETGKKKDSEAALASLSDFHAWLRSLSVLDPACGSGNFLYVALHAIKRVELEVMRAIEELTGQHALRFHEVDPSQFHGIEAKPWAREIAELTLWIGFHQWWRLHHDVQPEEPVLRDTGTLELRDAVLAWDDVRHAPARDRPDPTPRVPHPVTGELVPDSNARIRYDAYVNPRPAPWPEADFIIGNPPFMGQFRQREALGNGYVDALRATYSDVPESADLVMFWWYRAAQAVASGRTIRAGLITTQSITQLQNRQVIVDAGGRGARVAWAIADHYWNDGSDDARVRVAMTVIAKDPASATLIAVDGDARVVSEVRVPRLNADLSAHADVPAAAAVPLLANAGLSSPGVKLDGAGFIVEGDEAKRLLAGNDGLSAVLRPYRNGKDITTRPRDVMLIDFGTMEEEAARAYPILFDIVRDRVKPERDVKPDKGRREYWWRLGRAREQLREALEGLPRYIVTPETSKHRLFEFLPGDVAPDNSLIVVPSPDAFHLGVLSSAIHGTWALAAGSRLGIDGTPRYNKGPCFEAFPFPNPSEPLRREIGDVAERIDRHRKDALARSEKVTMTAMYNVIDRLRSGAPLSRVEQVVHGFAACGVLRDLHDELDRLVASAYGWSWPEPPALVLERLVVLHDARASEEAGGTVQWLRPAYQRPRFAAAGATPEPGLGLRATAAAREQPVDGATWPSDAVGQISALRRLAEVSPVNVDDAVQHFAGAPRAIVARHLETLAILGELAATADGRYAAAAAVA
jgi:hypothetical protein